jgi:hypothetical protein
LPEIARGDATFRCYGCYRMLSIPEGWTGRPAPRPATPGPAPTAGAPAGAGTRDARSARLAGRRGRGAALTGPPDAPPAGGPPTQMVPPIGPDDELDVGPGDAHGGWPVPEGDGRATAAASPAGSGVARGPAGGATVGAAGTATAGSAGTAAGWSSRTDAPGRSARTGDAPAIGAGWVSRRSTTPVSKPMRVLVWVVAFGIGLGIAAFVLRKIGVLDVNKVIDLYAGSGVTRFGILLLLLPLWALLSAAIAHFSLEALAKRRRPRRGTTPRRPPANTPSAG